MNAETVAADLQDLFRGIFDDPALRIEREMTADDVPGWDSARMVEIIMDCEAQFGITFTTRETDSLRCVGDLIDVITRKTGV